MHKKRYSRNAHPPKFQLEEIMFTGEVKQASAGGKYNDRGKKRKEKKNLVGSFHCRHVYMNMEQVCLGKRFLQCILYISYVLV